jgi:hypothetical protein
MEAPSIIQKTLSKAAVKQTHSIYSLRHTAICRRLTLSKGKVNIYSLAKNAGTSVDQIKRFYARNLPISEELGYLGYLEWVRSKNSKLKPATMNHISSAFSKVLKLARDRGVIDIVPALPRTARQDNPRPYFRFYPLVSKEEDEYQKLLDNAKQMECKKGNG